MPEIGTEENKMCSISAVTNNNRTVDTSCDGHLPRSRSGNKYILVLCDYRTEYPKAIPLKSIDAEHIAEQLIRVFSRIGIPREILTDQEAISCPSCWRSCTDF